MPRRLVLVLGDQLDPRSAAFDGFDRTSDSVWMAEVAEESTHVWTHKARIAVFLSAMRHFRVALTAAGIDVDYRELTADPQAKASDRSPGTLADALMQSLDRARAAGRSPDTLIVVEPGEWRVRLALETAARQAGIPLEIRADRHFFSSREEFAEHARGRKQLRLEYFYRPLRERYAVLMDDGEPAGGQWNFDAENRGSFPKSGPTPGPGRLPAPRSFPPDAITRDVIALVNTRFASHPGSLDASTGR
jgi:deoxyribodipyrimidine photolyase-related protein